MSNLATLLSALEARGLLRISTEREKPVVRFKHALTREATYNTILQARRAELHRAAAETLAALYAQPDLEMLLTIAEHWQRGNEDGNALETLLPHAQTLIYTGRSLSLSALLLRLERENLNPTQQHDLDMTLADAHAARGEYDPARTLYEHALASTPQPDERARALYRLGVAQDHLGDYAHALQSHQASLEISQRTNDLPLQAKATGGLGSVYWSLGDAKNAETHFQQSATLSAQLGNHLELANANYNLALLAVHYGHYDQAIALAERALAIDREMGHVTLTARSYQLLGGCYYLKGDLEQATTYYQRAVESSRATGDLMNLALGLNNLGELYRDENKLTLAIQAFTEATGYLRAMKQEPLLGGSLASLASAQNRLARALPQNVERDQVLQTAFANLMDALEIAQRLNTVELLGSVSRIHAEILWTRGEMDRARELAAQAVRFLEQGGMAHELQNALRTLEEMTTASSPPKPMLL